MNEIQMTFWHTLNMADPELWLKPFEQIIDHFLINGLFVKISTGDEAHADAFKAYMASAHPRAMRNFQRIFCNVTVQDRQNCFHFLNSSEKVAPEGPGYASAANVKQFNLKNMKKTFDDLMNNNNRSTVELPVQPFSTTKQTADLKEDSTDFNFLVDEIDNEFRNQDPFDFKCMESLDHHFKSENARPS